MMAIVIAQHGIEKRGASLFGRQSLGSHCLSAGKHVFRGMNMPGGAAEAGSLVEGAFVAAVAGEGHASMLTTTLPCLTGSAKWMVGASKRLSLIFSASAMPS